MTRQKKIRITVSLLAAALLLVSPLFAEDVEKRFRVSFHVGGYKVQDGVKSQAANVLRVVDPGNGTLTAVVQDPRNDSAVFGDLTIAGAPRGMFTFQYAANKILMLEVAAGYQTGDLRDLEMQVEFPFIDIPDTQRFNYTAFRIPAGTVEQVPIQLSALARFRPRASFNPYIGAGLGYTLVGFEPSQELDTLSLRLDQAAGGQLGLSPDGSAYIGQSVSEDLDGIRVDARDTFEWHVIGGAEYSFKRKWAAYLDVRYVFASRSLSVRINGDTSLGVGVPNLVELSTSPLADASQYGPVNITTGGLIDAGKVVPKVDATVPVGMTGDEFCADPSNFPSCVFELGNLDGKLDPGKYYLQGGDIKYGGFAAGIGIRYTF